MIGRMMYFFAKARESMRRAPWLTTATVAMLAVIFLLFNGFTLLAYNISNLAEQWVGAVRITVFLKPESTPEDAQILAANLRKRPEVQSVFYVTREEAVERFLARFPGEASIVEGLPENPLPASLELGLSEKSTSLDVLNSLSAEISKEPGVEEVVFGRELFAKLSGLIGLLRMIGVLLGLALGVAVLFLSANTIRLNLYARREEMDILQIVGATRWFIRWPFLIAGFLQGLFSAALSLALVFILYRATLEPLTETLSGPFGQVSIRFLPGALVLVILACGALLGTVGSFVALDRFWRTI